MLGNWKSGNFFSLSHLTITQQIMFPKPFDYCHRSNFGKLSIEIYEPCVQYTYGKAFVNIDNWDIEIQCRKNLLRVCEWHNFKHVIILNRPISSGSYIFQYSTLLRFETFEIIVDENLPFFFSMRYFVFYNNLTWYQNYAMKIYFLLDTTTFAFDLTHFSQSFNGISN